MEIVVPEEFKRLYVTDWQRPIVKIPDPVLRKKAEPVAKVAKKTQLLIDDMIRRMREGNGVGLAAPQLGVLQQIIVFEAEGMKPTALINPKIVKAEGEDIGEEGCLSIPGLYGDVKRAEFVEVEAYDRRGRAFSFEFEGFPARIVQHEIDHLSGILFIDTVDPATLHWLEPSRRGTVTE